MIYIIITLVVIIVLMLIYIIRAKHVTSVVDLGENSVPKGKYNQLMNYLESRKSRLSVDNRLEILFMWQQILLYINSNVERVSYDVYKSINVEDDTLTPAEHKHALIEALRNLSDKDEFSEVDYIKANYHLYYIIINNYQN